MAVLGHYCHRHQSGVLVLYLGASKVLLNVWNEDWQHELVRKFGQNVSQMLLGT